MYYRKASINTRNLVVICDLTVLSYKRVFIKKDACKLRGYWQANFLGLIVNAIEMLPHEVWPVD